MRVATCAVCEEVIVFLEECGGGGRWVHNIEALPIDHAAEPA